MWDDDDLFNDLHVIPDAPIDDERTRKLSAIVDSGFGGAAPAVGAEAAAAEVGLFHDPAETAPSVTVNANPILAMPEEAGMSGSGLSGVLSGEGTAVPAAAVASGGPGAAPAAPLAVMHDTSETVAMSIAALPIDLQAQEAAAEARVLQEMLVSPSAVANLGGRAKELTQYVDEMRAELKAAWIGLEVDPSKKARSPDFLPEPAAQESFLDVIRRVKSNLRQVEEGELPPAMVTELRSKLGVVRERLRQRASTIIAAGKS